MTTEERKKERKKSNNTSVLTAVLSKSHFHCSYFQTTANSDTHMHEAKKRQLCAPE